MSLRYPSKYWLQWTTIAITVVVGISIHFGKIKIGLLVNTEAQANCSEYLLCPQYCIGEWYIYIGEWYN